MVADECSLWREVDLAALVSDDLGVEWADFRAHYPGCSACSAEVWAYLDITTAVQGPEQSGHPASELLLDYQVARSSLAGERLATVERHLDHCATCRSELALLRRFDFDALPARPATAKSARPEPEASLFGRIAGLFGMRERFVVMATVLAALYIGVTLREPGTIHEAADPRGPLATSSEPLTPGPAPAPPPAVAPTSPSAPLSPTTLPSPSTPQPPRDIRLAEQPPVPKPAEPGATESTPAVAREPTPAPSEPEVEVELAPHDEILLAANLPTSVPGYAPDPLLTGGDLESVRMFSLGRSGAERLPEIRALGPDHVGATSRSAPTLFWYISDSSPHAVVVTLTSPDEIDPLLQKEITPPIAPGLHPVALEQIGIELAPETTYEWHASLVVDPKQRQRDLVARAAVRFAPPHGPRAARLRAARAADRAHVEAETGYWYDAFATLTEWSGAPGVDADTRERIEQHRAALLEQVGLQDVASALSGPGRE